LILTSIDSHLSLPVILANGFLLVAEPVGARLPAGTYTLEGASVNRTIPLGTIEIDKNCSRIILAQPSDASRAYSIVVCANAALTGNDGDRDDGLFGNAGAYNSALEDTIRSLLFAPEDILSHVAQHGRLSLSFLTPIAGNRPTEALVEEVVPNVARPRQRAIADYLEGLGIACDVALVVHGSMNYTRASAKFTIDDRSSGKVSFRMDGKKFYFGRATKVPGVATLSYYSFDLSHTPLHEFGHAASESTNGRIIDLYHDDLDPTALQINKRQGRPIPATFAKYDGDEFDSDPVRDHIGYGPGWSSYHPALTDTTVPNLMDDYWQAQSDPLACRFDDLTKSWLLDRIEAKAEGPR